MRFFLLSIILSLCCISASKAQDASQWRIDSLGAVFRSLSDRDTNKVLLCRDIAKGHYNPDSTIMWADRLEDLARKNKMPYYVAKAYGYYSWAYSMNGDPMTSLSYNYKALIISDSIKNDALKAYNYYRIGATYYKLQNQERSSYYYMQSADIYASLNDSVWVANCYRSIGENYLFQKMYSKSLEIYSKALDWDMKRVDSVCISDDYFGMGKALYRKFILNYSNPDIELLRTAKDYIYMAYRFRNQSIRNGFYSTRTLLEVLFYEQKYSDYDASRKKAILDSIRIITNQLDSITYKSGNNRFRMRYQLSSVYSKIAFRDYAAAKLSLDSLRYIIDDDVFKNIHDVYYLVSCNYYEAVGDYKSAFRYKTLYDEYIFNEQSVDLAVEYSVNEMRLEYDRAIAEKDARMQQFTTKVVFAISLILLFVGCLLFFYYRISRHRRALDGANKSLMIQREEIESQRDSLKAKNKIITDSVNYAQGIQKAVLPKDHEMSDLWGDHFIIFKPLNTVSGDFYWTSKVADTKVIVCADCTGHGVPGGFLSMLGISILNDIFGSYVSGTTAAQMLDLMRQKLMSSLGQSKQKYDNGIVYSTDGIDLCLVMMDEGKHQIQYAGAYRPLLIWRRGEIITHKPDKMPIGLYLGPERGFSNNVIDLEDGDVLYMFSDGMPDQFGYVDDSHSECVHFSSRRFAKMLQSIGHMPMEDQKNHVDRVMEDWKNGYPQLDDNILIGIRIFNH